jgi:hypothetical protein
MGSFPADMCPQPQRNSFIIINVDPSSELGSHWVMIANKNGKLYFGDSLGHPIKSYKLIASKFPNVIHLIHRQVQRSELCGPYAIYFACAVFNALVIPNDLSDYHLLQFIYKFL